MENTVNRAGQDEIINDTMIEDSVEDIQQTPQVIEEGPSLKEKQGSEATEATEVTTAVGEGEKNEGIEELRQNFLQLMSLDLEPDFEINAEITRKGVLASFFEGKGVSRTRLKDILEQKWKLQGRWRFKTLKPGLWGIFFDKEEDCVSILENRPWLINGKLLIIQEWPEQGDWSNADMSKAIFWVRATGPPTPYLNAMNTPRIAAKVGEYKGCDIVDQRTLARRGFLKFQVELSTQHQLSPGFFLDILRGRKEWIQFQYFRLPKFCYNCGFIRHDKNTCVRETSFAYPPEGAAVRAYGPWIRAESAVISCFNTRNQLNFFREDRSVLRPSTGRSPIQSNGKQGQNKGKGQDLGDIPTQLRKANENGKLKRKVIRTHENTSGTVYGKNLKVVDNGQKRPTGIKINDVTEVIHNTEVTHRERRIRSVSPRALRRHNKGKKNAQDTDEDILKKYSSRPPPSQRDGGVITTFMAHVGPTYEKMIDEPHKDLCKSRNPHKPPEPTHFPWPIYVEEIGLAEELMGPAPIDKFEPIPTLFHDPIDVSNEVHECPQQRKRKASLTLVPYVQRTEYNTREFSREAPQLPPFSPGPVDTPFKVGSGASSSSATRGGTKRRRVAGSKTSSRSRKQQNTARNEEGSTAINLEETLNSIEVNVTSEQNFQTGEEAALIKPPTPK
uniref:DUF4283 domain-containing protein n=1 Tax=Cannabis sativa TaxID=3483 RepID=A0A803QQJ2_CANSA